MTIGDSSTNEVMLSLENFMRGLIYLLVECPTIGLSNATPGGSAEGEHNSLNLSTFICGILKKAVVDPKSQARILKVKFEDWLHGWSFH